MLPINHLIKTLDRCCGEYEILSHSSSGIQFFQAKILQVATGEECVVTYGNTWESGGKLGDFLANRLNGLTRDDSGLPKIGDVYPELPSDFDCVPEPSEAPFKAGDWVVCVDDSASSGITVGSVYLVLGLDESGDPELTCDDGYRSYYLALRFRRARPDEIPQTVNQIPCGGCGAKTSKERCIGCFHNFGDEPQPATPRTPADAPPTLQQSNAEICRQNGWTVGTVLEGDEGLGPEQIEITAIGKDCVLACRETDEYESLWSLKYRQWKVVSPPALQLREGAWYRTEQGEVFGPMAVYDKSCNQWHVEANGELLWRGSGKEICPDEKPPRDLIREVPPPQLEPQPDSDGWIEWRGGECPVGAGEKIEVRLRQGTAARVNIPESYRWQQDGSISDIVAYRIVPPSPRYSIDAGPETAPQYRPFVSAEEFKPFRDRWWRYKQKSGTPNWIRPPVSYTDLSHDGRSWNDRFTECEFDDGSPFGVEVSK